MAVNNSEMTFLSRICQSLMTIILMIYYKTDSIWKDFQKNLWISFKIVYELKSFLGHPKAIIKK